MKERGSMGLLVFLILLSGTDCSPRRLLFWSPDGQRAAVIAKDGLHVSDAQGKLSDVVAKDVDLVAWLPDSRQFVAVSKAKVKSWEEAKPLLTVERRDKVLGLADRLHDEALAHQGKWDDFKPSMAGEISDGELGALILYVRDHRNQGLAEKLGEKWKDIESLEPNACVLQVYELSSSGATPGRVLTRTLEAVGEVRISPNGKALACIASTLGLSVLPMEGGELRTVAEVVAMFPDWTPDSQQLVYATTQIKSSETKLEPLGTIVWRRVCGPSGELLEKFGDAEESVDALFWPQMKIRCMRDGQILFTGMEVTLPAAKADMPQRATLFSIDPSKRRTIARVLPRESEAKLPDELAMGCFQLSPDQKRLMVCGKTVLVVTLATGEVQEVATDQEATGQGLPVWRNSEELAVVVPPKSKWGSENRYEYALWSGPDKARCLSCGWTDLFEEPKPTATAPASHAVGGR